MTMTPSVPETALAETGSFDHEKKIYKLEKRLDRLGKKIKYYEHHGFPVK